MDDAPLMPHVSLRPYAAAVGRGHRTLATHLAKHCPSRFRRARPLVAEPWRRELVPSAQIVLAEQGEAMIGFVTVDPKTKYLDQIVVAPEHWGSDVALILLDEAKRLSPGGLDLLVNKDNFRAIGFYGKYGFVYVGDDKNPVSEIAVNHGVAPLGVRHLELQFRQAGVQTA